MNFLLAAILTIRFAGDTLPAYDNYSVYYGTDRGLRYSPAASVFRIWSPTAEQARVYLYRNDSSAVAGKVVEMAKGAGGTWWVRVPDDWSGWRYVFSVRIGERWSREVPDPYARAAGVNGKRAVAPDMKGTDPPGWREDRSAAFSAANRPTDAVIYELHLRDIDVDSGSGVRNKGKFAGLAEWDAKNGEGLATGLSHLKELGVTHLHVLPFFDFNSVDESRPDSPQYNWGYDPL